jgi:multiple sugar transport system permease protein
VLLLQVYREAFQLNHGGNGAAVAVVLVVLISVISVLQFQVLRIGRSRA